jgi:aspartyl/asparaginyl beta-hydroxylase (cupin superfamily)
LGAGGAAHGSLVACHPTAPPGDVSGLRHLGTVSRQGAAQVTTALLAEIPSINAAMFTLPPPGSRLGAHRDPFARSLRYQLGTPWLPRRRWREVLLEGRRSGDIDETYIHQAENGADATRLILFCDIERPLSNSVL